MTLRRLTILFHSDSWWYGSLSEECLGVCRALCRKQRLIISVKVSDIMEGGGGKILMTLNVHFNLEMSPYMVELK